MTDTERIILEKLDALSFDVKETRATANKAVEAAERAEATANKAVEAAERAETTANKALEAVERVEVTANKALEVAERAETTANKALEVAERVEATANKAAATANEALKATMNVQLTLENVISRKLDLISEGHFFLMESLSRALQMENKREKMELEIINLRMDVNKIKAHLDIA